MHGVTVDEVIKLYSELMGVKEEFTIYDFWFSGTGIGQGKLVFKTSEMVSKLNESGYDLLGNGFNYWLGGEGLETGLWSVYFYGNIMSTGKNPLGIRPVVTLDSDVRVDSNNTGSGLSSKSALKLR